MPCTNGVVGKGVSWFTPESTPAVRVVTAGTGVDTRWC